jgi:hypothetical protein
MRRETRCSARLPIPQSGVWRCRSMSEFEIAGALLERPPRAQGRLSAYARSWPKNEPASRESVGLIVRRRSRHSACRFESAGWS